MSISELIALAPSPQDAHGLIEDYSYPLSSEVDADSPWDADVHNVGDTGQIAIGIANDEGNPGNMIFTYKGEEHIIAPGYYLRVYTTSDVANCYHLIVNGLVRYDTPGIYPVKLLGLWYLNGQWYYNEPEVISLTVTVAEAPWPVTKPVHVYDNKKMKAQWYDISKADSKTIVDIDTAVLMGGRIDYAITYTQGMPIGETVTLSFNGQEIAKPSLSKGETKTGSVDVTGFIAEQNTVKVSFESAPGIWSEIMFDVWLYLGYSEEPVKDPKPAFQLSNLAWWQWSLIGLGGLTVLYIVTVKPQPPPVYIVRK